MDWEPLGRRLGGSPGCAEALVLIQGVRARLRGTLLGGRVARLADGLEEGMCVSGSQGCDSVDWDRGIFWRHWFGRV